MTLLDVYVRRTMRLLPYVANGTKMSRNETNPNGPPGAGGKGLGVMVFSNSTMGDFATVMQGNILDRPVVDHGEPQRFARSLL